MLFCVPSKWWTDWAFERYHYPTTEISDQGLGTFPGSGEIWGERLGEGGGVWSGRWTILCPLDQCDALAMQETSCAGDFSAYLVNPPPARLFLVSQGQRRATATIPGSRSGDVT
jgi:hypothetical protein